MDKVSEFILERFFVRTFPASENMRSQGTVVAGIARILLAIRSRQL
jgi:uncharacterized membrane protein